jgi:hypothetical protein
MQVIPAEAAPVDGCYGSRESEVTERRSSFQSENFVQTDLKSGRGRYRYRGRLFLAPKNRLRPRPRSFNCSFSFPHFPFK